MNRSVTIFEFVFTFFKQFYLIIFEEETIIYNKAKNVYAKFVFVFLFSVKNKLNTEYNNQIIRVKYLIVVVLATCFF